MERNQILPTFAPRKTGCGEIGRHVRLRIRCRKVWGFESLHPDNNQQGGQCNLSSYCI